MPQPIEMIPVPSEKRFDPVEERHASVGVMPTDAEQHDVESNQRVAERGEAKTGIGGDENCRAEDSGSDFEPPRQAIIGLPGRPGEDQTSRQQKCEVKRRNAGAHSPGQEFDPASSTASRMAAIMLSGWAMPWPASAKAVP